MAKKKCPICRRNMSQIDYRDINTLSHYISPWAKMKQGHETGACSKHQRVVSEAIKRARYMALMPYVSR